MKVLPTSEGKGPFLHLICPFHFSIRIRFLYLTIYFVHLIHAPRQEEVDFATSGASYRY